MTHTTPAFMTNLINQLPSALREAYEERAAIMEFDAGLPRAYAECLALLDILHQYGGIDIDALQNSK